MIWDDHQSRCIGELSFRSEVKAVRLRRDRVVVVLAQRIYVYRFSDLHLLDRINTIRNDQGLVALCADASNMVLACPGVSRGHVNVELYDLRRSTLIPAHESELAQVGVSNQGGCVRCCCTGTNQHRVNLLCFLGASAWRAQQQQTKHGCVWGVWGGSFVAWR